MGLTGFPVVAGNSQAAPIRPTDEVALLEPVASVAGNPEPPMSTVAPEAMFAPAAPPDGGSSATPVIPVSGRAAEIPLDAPLYETSSPLRSGGSLFTSDPLKQEPQPAGLVETLSECPAPEHCIDDYLWALYQALEKSTRTGWSSGLRLKLRLRLGRRTKP